MKNLSLITQLASILVIVSGSSAFATRSLTFAGSCDVYLKGSNVLTQSFQLKAGMDYDEMDINVPNCDGVYTKFTMQLKLHSTANNRVVADFRLLSKGKNISSSYTYGSQQGTVITFSSKLLDDSFVTCSANVQYAY